MCFSASASFSAAVACGAVGVLAMRRAERRDRMIAALPLLFGAHQATEGYVWLTHAEGCGLYAAYAFASIAFCLWPVYVPTAVWLSETDPVRRRITLWIAVAGLALDIPVARAIIGGLDIDFASSHIAYTPRIAYPPIYEYLYLTASVGALFVHRNAYVKTFGAVVVAFFSVSVLYFNQARFSVWCFFAAIASALVYQFVVSRADAAARTAPDENPVAA